MCGGGHSGCVGGHMEEEDAPGRDGGDGGLVNVKEQE